MLIAILMRIEWLGNFVAGAVIVWFGVYYSVVLPASRLNSPDDDLIFSATVVAHVPGGHSQTYNRQMELEEELQSERRPAITTLKISEK